MRTSISALLALVALVRSAPAACPANLVSTADQICPGSGTCVVTRSFCIAAGSTLDFAGRDLVLKQRGTFDVQGGSMLVKAASVTLEGGSALLGTPHVGSGGSIGVEATVGDIMILKDALIDSSGAPAGRVDIEAVGNVRIAGAVHANGTSDDGDGGTVTIDAQAIDVPGTLEFFGRGEGFAGDATLLAIAGFSLTGTLDGSGQDGGSLDVEASTGEVSTTAQIRLQATRAGGDGGSVGIVAAGRVILGGQFRLAGDGSGDGGSGGTLDVDAGGPIEVRATLIDVSGARPTGIGGVVSLLAGGDITVTSSSLEVQAQAKGSEGLGGFVDVDAEGSVQLPSISAFGGGAGGGGSVFASAWCALTLPAGRTIDTRGTNGDTTLSAGGQITVAGRLLAGRENRIAFLDETTPPNLAGGTFEPPVNQVPDPGLIPCGGPLIPGCGDSTKNESAGEECDDGNTDSCDGCSRSCKLEGCGNGRIECAEQCDDGNTADCDRCHGDCTRPDDVCGDSITECGEEQDDGNPLPCDGVSPECRHEVCGNDITECAEQCDDGAAGSPACSPQCQIQVPPRCGDGVVQPEDGETCDDQNAVDCDGCSRACQIDGCGSGQIEASCNEGCDDFNTRPGDGCSASCQIEVCGNGHVDTGEQCDDGNTNDCDGCRTDCTVPISPCPVCTSGGPDRCVPCTGAIDCDPMRACGPSACSAGVCTPVTPPNCDDANACTVDTCDPASGCVSTPVVCQDSTACDGTLGCNPATGQCVNGPAPSCDDGDACTDDACTEAAPGTTCSNQLRPGLEGATCRLSSLQSLIDSASDIPKATRRKLKKQAKAIAKKLPVAAGTGRKAQKAHKQISNALKALTKTVAKAQRKLSPDTVSKLNAAITSATIAVGGL
jgi:cysteine-rich repeat protein